MLCASLVACVLSLPMDAADQQADPSLVIYRSVVPSTVNIGRVPLLRSSLLWRKKRDVAAPEMDQQADPAMIMYSTLPVMSRIHSPFFWRKKRDVSATEMDQQADESALVLLRSSAVPTTVGLRHLGLVNSPFLWRKKRDTADQTAEEARILYTMPMVNNIWGRRTIMMPFLKK